jgi:hypothetical protein
MTSHNELINNILEETSVHKLKHFQPLSLFCHLWCKFLRQIYQINHHIWSYYDPRSSFDESFSYHIQLRYIVNQMHTNIHTHRTVASSQHQHREERQTLGRSCQYKKTNFDYSTPTIAADRKERKTHSPLYFYIQSFSATQTTRRTGKISLSFIYRQRCLIMWKAFCLFFSHSYIR